MIIGLSGLKYSGKSTVAKILCEKYNFIEYSFADPLKRGLIEMLGLSYNQLYVNKESIDPYWNVTPRKLLQTIGTELMRDHLPKLIPEMKDIWIKRMEKSIQSRSNKNIVISDCRFIDEACFIRNKNGCIIRINRPSDIVNDLHESEKLDFDCDYNIYNSGTIQDLEKSISHIMNNIYTNPL